MKEVICEWLERANINNGDNLSSSAGGSGRRTFGEEARGEERIMLVDFYMRSILLVDFYPRSIFVGWHLFREYFVGWLLYEEFFCRLTFIFQACTEEKETFKEMFALLRWAVVIIIIIMAANITNLTLLSKSSRRYNLKFRDWAFMMFAISNFLTSLGYPIPYTFVPV